MVDTMVEMKADKKVEKWAGKMVKMKAASTAAPLAGKLADYWVDAKDALLVAM